MRAGRTRLTALGCLLGLLAAVGVHAAPTARPDGRAGGAPRPHGVHLVAAAAVSTPAHPRPDLPAVLPVRAQLTTGPRHAGTPAAGVTPSTRALVAAVARGPPGEPA